MTALCNRQSTESCSLLTLGYRGGIAAYVQFETTAKTRPGSAGGGRRHWQASSWLRPKVEASYSPVNISPPPALPGRVFAVVENWTYRPLSHTCSLTSIEKSSLCSVLLSRRPRSRSMDNDYRNDFSDISDCELLEASQVVKQLECNVVKKMCSAAGFVGYFTNRSLRASCCCYWIIRCQRRRTTHQDEDRTF